LAQSQAQRDAAQARLDVARCDADSVQSDLAMVRSELQAVKQMHRQTSDKLDEILASPGWRFVTWVGRIRLRLLPPGSRGERWWLAITDKMAARLKSSMEK
jgi:hypothetical protein